MAAEDRQYEYDPILDDPAASQIPDDDFFESEPSRPNYDSSYVVHGLPGEEAYNPDDPFSGTNRKFREFAQSVYSQGMYSGYDEILTRLRGYYQELLQISENRIPGEEFVPKRQIAIARNSSEATNHRIINSVCMEFIKRSDMIHEVRGATPLFAKERTVRLLEIVDTLRNCGLTYEEIHAFLSLPLDRDADAVLEQKAAEMARDDRVIGSFAVMQMLQSRLLPVLTANQEEQEKRYTAIIEAQQKQIETMNATIQGFQKSLDRIGESLGIEVPKIDEAASDIPAQEEKEPSDESEELFDTDEGGSSENEVPAEESSAGKTLTQEDFAAALERIERLEQENEELRKKKKGFFARLFGG